MSKALSLFFFAGLLLMAASADARQKPLEFRVGDSMRGPVESVRTEVADISLKDGQPSEGARRLSQLKKYSPDGKRSETTFYGPGGAARAKSVLVYDDGGNLIESSSFDGKGSLLAKRLYVRNGDEAAVYDGAGRLQELTVLVWNETRDRLVEIRKYDGNGALLKRDVNTRDADNKKSTWESFGPGGDLKEKTTFDLNYDGPKRQEQTLYHTDGTVAGGRLATSDASTRDLKAVVTDPNGEPLRRTHERREYDSRRNLVKITNYRWDYESGSYVPHRVAYHIITYRD